MTDKLHHTVTDRRGFVIGATAAATALAVLPATADRADAKSNGWEDAVKKFTGGKDAADGGVSLDAPEIAENGATVPFGVKSDGAVQIAVFTTGNQNPNVVTFNFTDLSGKSAAKGRMRLGKTQDVIVVAKMGDGSFKMTKKTVKVTIGGCGG